MRRRRFARRGFRRKRRNLVWFPNDGQDLDGGGEFFAGNIPVTLTIPADGTPVTVIKNVTFDGTTTTEGGGNVSFNTNLGDVLANEYFIRRIVGGCFAALAPFRNVGNDPSQASCIQIAAGLFVARAQDELDVATTFQPIGLNSEVSRWNSYGPIALHTMREPWIWRRQWILGNYAFQGNFFNQAGANADVSPNVVQQWAVAPPSNMHYSAGADHHIDQRTLRKVGNDSRLWAAVSAFNAQVEPVTHTVNEVINAQVLWDLRILGQLRKARNTGTF